MKKSVILSSLIATLFSFTYGFAQLNPTLSNRKVQVAILFDTSNSMDGLIDQAKARIWGIINEINTLRYQGQIPRIEIALYEYGNSGLALKDNYVRRILDLSSDLDQVSQELFALRTNGGDEFCGAVMKASLDELKWSNDLSDLKMIYIAGNEPFTQGPIHYKEVCAKAKKMGIFVNTIYCGDYDTGVREGWKDGASCSDGEFFNINSDEKVVHIATPYDDRINQYNDSLNRTYYGYGSLGERKKSAQLQEDANAESVSISSKSERVAAKASYNYSNSTWDLIDGVEQGDVDLSKMKDEELPQELRGKTIEEKEQFIAEQKAKRANYQEEIKNLAVERQKFIDDELQKRAENQEALDDFGSKVNESIEKRAIQTGYTKEK